jgi:tetratricopeptide (TPR) repeat protein
MDFLTITLIVVGTVLVGAFVVLAYLEVTRKNAGTGDSDSSSRDSATESLGPAIARKPEPTPVPIVEEPVAVEEAEPEPEVNETPPFGTLMREPEPSTAEPEVEAVEEPAEETPEPAEAAATPEPRRFSWDTPEETEKAEEGTTEVEETKPSEEYSFQFAPKTTSEPVEEPVSSEPVVEEPEPEPEPVVAAAEPEPEPETPSSITGGLNEAQKGAMARLSIMPAGFDRDAAIAVANCTGEDVDVLVKAGLLDYDPDHGELVWHNAIRLSAARSLAPSDAHAVRLRHAEHFIDRGIKAQADLVDSRGGAPISLELFGVRLAHFTAAFEFLKTTQGLETQLLKLLDAVGYTSVLDITGAARVTWLTAGLEAARTLKDRVLERDLLGHLGSAYSELKDFEQAIESHQQAAAISRELSDRHEEGRNLGNMGRAWHRLGNLEKASEYYELVLGIMRDSGDRVREGLALTSLGQVAADQGEYEKAVDYFEQHLQVAQETKDTRSAMLALSGIGDAYVATGDLEEAQNYYNRQLQTARQIRDLQSEGNALGKLGKVHLDRGNSDQAVVCYDRQVEVAHLLGDAKSGVRAMGELGLAHLKADRTSRAIECFDEQLKVSREIQDRDGEAHALLNAARAVHSRGQVVDAITRASAALPVFQEIGSPEVDAVRAEIEQWRSERY